LECLSKRPGLGRLRIPTSAQGRLSFPVPFADLIAPVTNEVGDLVDLVLELTNVLICTVNRDPQVLDSASEGFALAARTIGLSARTQRAAGLVERLPKPILVFPARRTRRSPLLEETLHLLGGGTRIRPSRDLLRLTHQVLLAPPGLVTSRGPPGPS
jgi:hypothetical protein